MLELFTGSSFSLSLPSPKSKAAFNFMANKCTRVLFPLKKKSCKIFEDFSATVIPRILLYTNIHFTKRLFCSLTIFFLIPSFLLVSGRSVVQ